MTLSLVLPVASDPAQQEPARTLRAVPPPERPLRRRRTARVLLADSQGRVLLFADRDPAIAGSTWWMTPGGGVDDGETEIQAAVREVQEETGLVLDPAVLIGPIATRRVWHGYSDVVIDQRDTFFAAYVDVFTVDVSGHTQEERVTMTSHRWWSRAELLATTETVWPATLIPLWDSVQTFQRSDRVPIELPDVDESTVPPDLGWTD